MRKWTVRIGTPIAVLILAMTFLHASWLAPDPKGAPKLVAHRGIAQLYDNRGVGRDTCTADRIEQPWHSYLENTVEGIKRARELGAWMVEIDIAPTADGELAVFHDWTLDCRTDGTGPIREATMEELKTLDMGHGYTADGGETYPFRGEFVGAMPNIEEAVHALGLKGRMMVNFKSGDAEEADLIAAKLNAIGRDPSAKGDAFYGHPDPVNRIRELYPDVWAWSPQEARRCSEDYVKLGWTSVLPESCRGKTMIIPLNYQWAFWGWPNRLIARMEEYGGQIIVVGPHDGNAATGITLPEQLTEIPASFNGYVWVEDGLNVIPALIQRFDDRSEEERTAGASPRCAIACRLLSFSLEAQINISSVRSP